MDQPRRGRVRGPLAALGAEFCQELAEQGYAVRSAETHLLLMARLSGWLEQTGLKPSELSSARVEEFLGWNRAQGCRFPKSAAGAGPLLLFLREHGVVPPAAAPTLTVSEQLLERFGRHLATERGLADGTIVNHVHAGRLVLRALQDGDGEPATDVGLTGLTAARVSEIAVQQCQGRSIAAAKNLVNGLRCLLRFLYLEQITAIDLSGAVPTVAGWGSGLPRGVDAATVGRLLDSCDRGTVMGSRDYAILMLLTRLGLRIGEVAALELGDIDWSAGTLLARGKANRWERLPLPADVGQALADHLTHRRAECTDRAVFLRVLAPHRRLTSGAIIVVVQTACRRAGLAPIAAHRLRHTVASELLRRGAGLPEIGQLLRHRSAAVTSTYAKVDTVALRELARPWPGGAA
jgi:integrase/recombinase XerD